MIKLKKAKKIGLGYKFFKFLSDRFHDNIYYRKVKYLGLENIPKDKPTLLGPNHQNALMDAMAILASKRSQSPTFLARSDIFSSNLLSNLLLSMKILPVYRIQDGKDKLAKNDEIFDISVEILEDKKVLVIFPEATHTDKRSILTLKKGLMRVAFHTAEKNNFEIDLHIIPVGIYYENYYSYRSKLLVIYGKPIRITDYQEKYKQNPQSTLLTLKKYLQEKIEDLAIHIKNKQYYDIFENAREIFDFHTAKENNLQLKKLYDKYQCDKKIIHKLNEALEQKPEKFDELQSKIKDYFSKLKIHKLKDYLFDKPVSFIGNIIISLTWVILSPFLIGGFLNFTIPVCTPELIIKKFEDTQFHSSVRYIVSLFLTFVWGLIGFTLLWIFVDFWWALGYFLFQYPFFIIWIELRKLTKKLVGKWRFFTKSKLRNELKLQRAEIIKIYSEL
jgi:1-acyl-sn-glycerol-3-phosphate acyltransferase